MNSMWLDMQERSDPRWMTYKQAASLGAQVQGGEKSCLIQHWKWTDNVPDLDAAGNRVLDDQGKPQTRMVRLERPQVFYAYVFNAEQIDGLEPYQAPELKFEPVAEAEKLLEAGGVPIKHDQGDRAYYSVAGDVIHLPDKTSFETPYEYYATALHELGHATGHVSRFDRGFGPRGTEMFAKEELRAEMASYLVSRELGLGHYPERHAAYVESWLKSIREDRNVLFQAARDAERIATWIRQPELRPELEKQAAHRNRRKDKAMENQAVNIEQKPASPSSDKSARTYIAVPYAEKDHAKEAGAKWDRRQKSWYVAEGHDLASVTKWLPENRPVADKAQKTARETDRADGKDHDPVAEFADELKAAGVLLKQAPLMDGKWHRVPLEGDNKGQRNASYRAFLDGQPNGHIHNFRSGATVRWVSQGETLNKEQRAALKAETARRQAERIAERKTGQEKVAAASVKKFESAEIAGDQRIKPLTPEARVDSV